MNNRERDPGYNPEHSGTQGIEGEPSHEKEVDLRPEVEVFRDNERRIGEAEDTDLLAEESTKLMRLSIPEYSFSGTGNPYRWDAPEPRSLLPIARQLDAAIARSFPWHDILVRGVQSVATGMTRGELLTRIRNKGYDIPVTDGTYEFYAVEYRPFSNLSSTVGLFEGFHKWKPKCEVTPQLPIDTVMIFDAAGYDSVAYVHPRHGNAAHDRYKLKLGANRQDVLLAIILIN